MNGASEISHGKLRCLSNRSLLVDALSIVYGLGSWIAMTGLWVEVPLLVQRLPEGWALASYLTLILQVANVGPIAYGMLHRWWPEIVSERSATHFQLAIGTFSTLLLIFFWSTTVTIGDSSECSLPLFILSFGLSIVDCTSSVVFLPYMANFRSIYLTPYLMGEGLSGLLPSLVAIGQGIENPECVNESYVEVSDGGAFNETKYRLVSHVGEPRFEPEYFFLFLLAMVAISWTAFILLDNLAICKNEMVPRYSSVATVGDQMRENRNSENTVENTEKIFMHRIGDEDKTGDQVQVVQPSHIMYRKRDSFKKNVTRFSRSETLYYYLLFLQGWASVTTFGVFPAIQPYSCLPYGDKPYHLAVTLCGVAYPVACMVAMFWEVRSVVSISILSIGATMISAYIMCTAVLSPEPPLRHTQAGAILMVTCWVVFIGLFSYIKTMVTVLLGEYWGQNGLFWCGAVTQAGAAIGAFLMFLLVNVFYLFKDDGLCIT